MTEPILPQWMWDIATDPSVPPGVIVFVDPDGTRHPMPLCEFCDEDIPLPGLIQGET